MPSAELPTREKQLDGQYFGGHVQARPRISQPLKYTGSLDSFKSQDLTPVIGREYEGLQVRDLLKWGDERIRDLAAIISQRGVVVLRDQEVTTDDMKEVMLRITELAGSPESSGLHVHPLTEEGSELGDQISVISSVKQKLGGGLTHQLSDTTRLASAGWHTDISFEPVPSDYAMLKIHTLPETGGDTIWASGYEIYDRLSPALRTLLEGLTATHDAKFFLEEARLLGNPLRKDIRGSPLNQGDGLTAVHPVIRTNPVTGWKSVYVNRGFTKRINGLTKDESDLILGYLFNLVTQNHDAQVRFKWRKNDIAIWDNRSTWHTATYDYGEARVGDRLRSCCHQDDELEFFPLEFRQASLEICRKNCQFASALGPTAKAMVNRSPARKHPADQPIYKPPSSFALHVWRSHRARPGRWAPTMVRGVLQVVDQRVLEDALRARPEDVERDLLRATMAACLEAIKCVVAELKRSPVRLCEAMGLDPAKVPACYQAKDGESPMMSGAIVKPESPVPQQQGGGYLSRSFGLQKSSLHAGRIALEMNYHLPFLSHETATAVSNRMLARSEMMANRAANAGESKNEAKMRSLRGKIKDVRDRTEYDSVPETLTLLDSVTWRAVMEPRSGREVKIHDQLGRVPLESLLDILDSLLVPANSPDEHLSAGSGDDLMTAAYGSETTSEQLSAPPITQAATRALRSPLQGAAHLYRSRHPPPNSPPTMSQKITGKNLHYDQTLPPFLARLKGQHAGDADSPDPILASRRRAAKPRSASEEAEDGPLIVDDDGNVVQGMKVGVDGTVKEDAEGEGKGKSAAATTAGKEEGGEEAGQEKAKVADKEKVAAIGGSKKRKAGKIVGADADAEDAEGEDSVAQYKAATQGKGDLARLVKKDAEDKSKAPPAKAKKKAKKIKLSFGDDDGD
ncbi:hypothetical protein VPNG_07013 [Cytospora leucostoma]|uniref:TauD/TfdA-like domain-containing protein n=1 Tax=Cytospora leucostoma TaxID=1230097 RepID=A0A423WN96_9PEZI|nr:hypothetical protein VPNG_07013 [Cytospora leucostoma]